MTEICGVTGEAPDVTSQKVLLKAEFKPFSIKMEGEKELKVFIIKK
ncbi:MAG: hypothetical protein IPN56_06650 [Chitinophagaceae bacterium]|nr:hypothetical protein [Chitinophagaceae bacterium]